VYWYNNSTQLLFATGSQVSFIAPSANFSLVAKDSLVGCPGAFDTVFVTSHPKPNLVLQVPQEICRGSALELSQIPVNDLRLAGANLSYYTGAQLSATQQITVPVVNPVSSTTYHLLAQTAFGCRDTILIPVTVHGLPNVQIAQGDTLYLCRAAESVLSAQATGSSFIPFTYSWSNGLNFQQIPILGSSISGTTHYRITATDAKGCSATDTIRVVTAASITQTDIIQIQPVSQCGLTNGSITLKPMNGIAPYRFAWSGPISGILSNINSQGTIPALASGAYRVTITDSSPNGGCGMTLPLILVDAPNFSVDTVMTLNPQCYGQNTGQIALLITAQAPSVAWSNNQTGAIITALTAGTYTATITDGGCQQVVSGIQITQPDPIQIIPNALNPVICFGGNQGAIDVFVTGGTGAYQYLWSNMATTQDITNLTAGTYTVVARDARQCTGTVGINISEPSALMAIIDSVASPYCNADSSGYLSVKFAGGATPYQYVWENQSTSNVRTHLRAGNYRLTLTDANQCSFVFTHTLTEPAALEATVTSIQQPSCIGVANGAITLAASGGTSPYTAVWSQPNTTGLSLQNAASGQYSVTASDSRGCSKSLQNLVLNSVQAIPVTQLLVQDIACFGNQTGSIEVQIANPAQYTYRLNGATAAAANQNLEAGAYQVEVQNQLGCTYRDSITVRQPAAALQAWVNSVEQPLCAGAQSGSIDVTSVGGTQPYQFNWSNGDTTQSIQGLQSGSYALQLTDANGCSAQVAAVQIAEPTALTAIVTKRDIPCFGVTNGQLEVQVQGGVAPYRYLWNTNDTIPALYQRDAGLYSVTITDQNGCVLELKTIEIEDLRQDFQVSLVRAQNATCRNQQNGQIVVSVNNSTGPYAFNWGQPIGLHMRTIPNDSLMSLAPGTYQVTVTNGTGCVAVSAPIEIFNPPLLQVAQTLTNVDCRGNATGRIEIAIQGGVPPYQFIWSDGGPDTTIRTGLFAGMYQVSVSDFNQCEMVIGPFEIQEPTNGIQISIDSVNGGIGQDNCASCKGRIMLNIAGGQSNYNYLWNDGNTEQDRMNLCAGAYTLTVSDLSGCTRVWGPTQIVALSNPPGFSSIRIENVACKGDSTGIIKTVVEGGTAPYQVFWENNQIGDTIYNVGAGLYRTTITDAAQCTSTFGVLVVEPDSNITVSHVYQSPSWGVGNGRIDLQILGGVQPYTINWSPNAFGQMGANITNLDAGVYTAYISDFVGCDTIYQIDITSGVFDTPRIVPSIEIYPNPVPDWLKVRFNMPPSANFSPAHYSIATITGARVQAGQCQNQPDLSISVVDLSAGYYLFSVTSEDGEVVLGRFVKE
jgi:large repetitive protein